MTGSPISNGPNGGAFANMSEWARQPLLGYRILQDPGAYADTSSREKGGSGSRTNRFFSN